MRVALECQAESTQILSVPADHNAAATQADRYSMKKGTQDQRQSALVMCGLG